MPTDTRHDSSFLADAFARHLAACRKGYADMPDELRQRWIDAILTEMLIDAWATVSLGLDPPTGDAVRTAARLSAERARIRLDMEAPA